MKRLVYVLIFVVFSTQITFAGGIMTNTNQSAAWVRMLVRDASLGMDAVYYNPAGLDRSKSSEAMFSYMNYIADINISYFAASGYLGDLGSIGFFMKALDIGDIPVTTIANPDGTGLFYSPSFYTMGLTYSKSVTDRVSIGINAKLISESIQNTSASGFAIDFGVQYAFNKDFHIGVVVNNVGTNMKFTGNDLQVKTEIPDSYPNSRLGAYDAVTEEFQIPSYYELSLAYKLHLDEANGLALGGVFRNNNSLEDEMRIGLEYDYSKMLYLRAGYTLMIENADQAIYTYTVGAGVNMKLMDALNVRFDYAFRPVNEFPTDNHVFTLLIGIN